MTIPMMMFLVPVPVFLWLILRVVMPPGPYEMDHGNGARPGTFFPHLLMYHALFYFIAGFGLWYSLAMHGPAAWLLLPAAIHGLIFIGVSNLFVEEYMHSRYPNGTAAFGKSNYTLNRRALVLTMGTSSVAWFIFGVLADAEATRWLAR